MKLKHILRSNSHSLAIYFTIRRLYMEEGSPSLGEIQSRIAESFSLDSETASAMALQYDDADGDRMTLSAGTNSTADVDIMLRELVR